MKKFTDRLLFKYERVDKQIRQKAIVLFLTIGILSSVLIISSFVKFFFFEVSFTDRYYQIGLVVGLTFVFTLLYRRLLKHATFVFLMWIAVYFFYLLVDQELLLYLLIPIFFTIIFIIQTSKYQPLAYVLLSFGFLLNSLIGHTVDFNHQLISNISLLSYFISILYIIGYCVFIYVFVRVINKEIMNADTIVQNSTIDFMLDVNKRSNLTKIDNRQKSDNSSILLLGVNELELLNDSLGFDTCEILLKEVISIIRSTVRIDDYILRWNHDEFLIILHQTTLSNSAIVAEKIRKAIEFTGFTENKKRITVTICATSKREDHILFDAIERAQEGLSKAKTQRKNMVFIQ